MRLPSLQSVPELNHGSPTIFLLGSEVRLTGFRLVCTFCPWRARVAGIWACPQVYALFGDDARLVGGLLRLTCPLDFRHGYFRGCRCRRLSQ